MFEEVKTHVNELFRNTSQIPHFERTCYWLQESYNHLMLGKPEQSFQIAAYAHDIERATREQRISQIPLTSQLGYCDPEFLKHHQEKGAEIIVEFLRLKEYPEPLCQKVYGLVSRHEVGGTEDQNLLMDCDSLSFFDTQIDGFITKQVPRLGVEKVRDKFNWMYSRISTPERQVLARENYHQALERLNV